MSTMVGIMLLYVNVTMMFQFWEIYHHHQLGQPRHHKLSNRLSSTKRKTARRTTESSTSSGGGNDIHSVLIREKHNWKVGNSKKRWKDRLNQHRLDFAFIGHLQTNGWDVVNWIQAQRQQGKPTDDENQHKEQSKEVPGRLGIKIDILKRDNSAEYIQSLVTKLSQTTGKGNDGHLADDSP